jgi:glucose-6-phosphate isomerase
MLVDFSKNIITEKTLELLVQIVRDSGLEKKIEAMFSGEKINFTENRCGVVVGVC